MHLSKNVPTIAIHMFFKNFEIPTKDEGYTEIITIQFEKSDVDL